MAALDNISNNCAVPSSILITSILGVVAALIAIWGVVTQRSVARRRATLDLISALERDRDVIEARRKFIALAKAPGGLAPYADADKEPTHEAQSIRLILNEFELIAIGIQRGIVDYELYKRWNRSGAIMVWNYAAPFVMTLRARTSNDAIYHEFQEMVRWLKGEIMPKRGRFFGLWF